MTVETFRGYVPLPEDPNVEVEVYVDHEGHVHVEAWDHDDSLGYFDLSEQQARDAVKSVFNGFDRPLYLSGWFSVHGKNNGHGSWTTNAKLKVDPNG